MLISNRRPSVRFICDVIMVGITHAHLLLLLSLGWSTRVVSALPYHHRFADEQENGIIKLIIKAYTDNVLRELQAASRSCFTNYHLSLLKQRMSELYDHIRHHPALYQRYLWVGKGKPRIDPDFELQDHQGMTPPELFLRGSTRSTQVQKRSAAMFPSEEICKTSRQWEQVNRTHDFYDHEIEVIQDGVQQFVFTYRCAAHGGPCIGISPLYDSECTERYGWMYMYYRRVDHPKSRPQWGYVAAPHHCACKITPKFIPEV